MLIKMHIDDGLECIHGELTGSGNIEPLSSF